jgi:hypothetical protein
MAKKVPESNCVFDLVKLGLVVIEHPEKRDNFMIVRPASLTGSLFRGWEGISHVGMGGTYVATNAPPAMLDPCENGWVVDMSSAAAPGPGPVWFHEEFENAWDAVDAIEQCFFGTRVDNKNDSLERFFGRLRQPEKISELPSNAPP